MSPNIGAACFLTVGAIGQDDTQAHPEWAESAGLQFQCLSSSGLLFSVLLMGHNSGPGAGLSKNGTDSGTSFGQWCNCFSLCHMDRTSCSSCSCTDCIRDDGDLQGQRQHFGGISIIPRRQVEYFAPGTNPNAEIACIIYKIHSMKAVTKIKSRK